MDLGTLHKDIQYKGMLNRTELIKIGMCPINSHFKDQWLMCASNFLISQFQSFIAYLFGFNSNPDIWYLPLLVLIHMERCF